MPMKTAPINTLLSTIIRTPESSQTDSDDVSPQIHRKRKPVIHSRDALPRFSISIDEDEAAAVLPSISGGTSTFSSGKSRPVIKSSSALGLSLLLSQHTNLAATSAPTTPSGQFKTKIITNGTGNGSSTASSRDTSPCRELQPLVSNLKPPIVIRRGPRGFGFTVHTVRVYYGDSDFYTMHHLVMAVDEGSPAFEAGLRPADLITHVNSEPVQGLYHTQVLQLLLAGPELVTLRATPLNQTSIQTGGRKRNVWQSKMARRSVQHKRGHGQISNRKISSNAGSGSGSGGGTGSGQSNDRKRKTSLFRRISSKRASAEMHHQLQQQSQSPPVRRQTPHHVQLNRLSLSPLDTGNHHNSSGSSSSSSAPSTPTGLTSGQSQISPIPSPCQRPSTLYGLKHKTPQTSGVTVTTVGSSGPTKILHTSTASSRRKSVGHIPLSPLARTPSPSPNPVSPTRSPSPLAFPLQIVGHHQLGASNLTQSYQPALPNSNDILVVSGPVGKKSFAIRSKSTTEVSSPLLRRALSPDRLHPRSGSDAKQPVISPLCQSSGGGSSSSTSSIVSSSTGSSSSGNGSSGSSLSTQQSIDLLPRIAEERDSPTTTTASAITNQKVSQLIHNLEQMKMKKK